MPCYLDSIVSGVTRHTTIPAVTFAGDFEVKAVAAQLGAGSNGTFIFAGSGVVGQNGLDLYRNSSGNYQLFINNTSVIGTTTAVTNNIAAPDTVIVRRLSGVVDLIINGVSRGTFSTSATLSVERLFHRSGWANYGRMGLYEFTITSGGSYNTSWSPSNSPSGGSTWTSSGGQALTQAGSWPANDSEWVPYGNVSDTALQATATGVSTATAALTTAVRLAAAAVGVSTATASLSTGVRLQASASGQASASAQLTTAISLVANAIGQSSATANLTAGSTSLAASAVCRSTATATLTTGIQFAASASGQSSATAQLSTAIRLAASAVGQSTATASFAAAAAQLSAAAYGRSSATATLTTGIALAANARASSDSTAQLTTAIQLSASAVARSSATATLGSTLAAYYLDEARTAYVTSETRISAVFGDERITVVDREDRIQVIRGNA